MPQTTTCRRGRGRSTRSRTLKPAAGPGHPPCNHTHPPPPLASTPPWPAEVDSRGQRIHPEIAPVVRDSEWVSGGLTPCRQLRPSGLLHLTWDLGPGTSFVRSYLQVHPETVAVLERENRGAPWYSLGALSTLILECRRAAQRTERRRLTAAQPPSPGVDTN